MRGRSDFGTVVPSARFTNYLCSIQFEDKRGGQFLVRPYAEQFLVEMAEMYEIVIFTAAVQEYADWILDQIDPNGVISHRLYRQHTSYHLQTSIKVSALGHS